MHGLLTPAPSHVAMSQDCLRFIVFGVSHRISGANNVYMCLPITISGIHNAEAFKMIEQNNLSDSPWSDEIVDMMKNHAEVS